MIEDYNEKLLSISHTPRSTLYHLNSEEMFAGAKIRYTAQKEFVRAQM